MSAKATGTARRLRPIWITSISDDSDHAVTRENMAAGMESGAGTYPAECGATVVPPSMTEPPQSRCPYCRAALRMQRRR